MNLDFIPKPRLIALIYGDACVGKSTAIFSLLKNPNLNVRILAIDPNALSAIELGLKIHGIEITREKQLVVAIPDSAKFDKTNHLINSLSEELLTKVGESLLNFKGHDVFTGKQITLGNVSSFSSNDVLVIDSFTSFVHSIKSYAARETATLDKASNSFKPAKDPRAVYGKEQPLLVGLLENLVTGTKAHIVALGHSTVSVIDDKSSDKQKILDLDKIHPAVGSKSIVQLVCGKFLYVLYAKKMDIAAGSKQSPFVWSIADKNVMTLDRFDKERLKQHGLSLDKLPPDFNHPAYNFFTQEDK